MPERNIPRRRRRIAAVAGALALMAAGPAVAAHGAVGSPAAQGVGSSHNPLLKQYFAAGGGGDIADASPSAMCTTELGKPNPYPNPSPNVDVISGDTVVPVGSQTGCMAAQNETTVATNPANPNNLVAGANDYRVFNTRENRNDGSGFAYTSFDGGKTWKNVLAPHLTFQTGATGALSAMDSAGDPAIAFGPNNVVYYANLVFSRFAPAAGGTEAPSGIVVSKSTDGGLTWGEPSIVHTDGVAANGTFIPAHQSNDKEWIAVDGTTGNVYVTWTTFVDNPDGSYQQSPIVLSRSLDGGATWGAPTEVTVPLGSFAGQFTPFAQGSNPVVGNDGSVKIAYEDTICATLACNSPTDHDAIAWATSSDHGQTFTNEELAFDADFPVNADVGRSTVTGENFRLNSYPQATVDRTTGGMYITWADDRNGQYDAQGQSVKTNGAAFLIHDKGKSAHWTTAQQVGPGGDQFFPAVAASKSKVVVTYYTRSYDPTGIGVDYAYVTGTAGQIGSAAQQRITTVTENPDVQFVGIGAVTGTVLQGEFIGDYSAVAMGPDQVMHPVWTDFRGNVASNTPNQDVYTQAIQVK
jgi:Neuraminidase (sialidase)